MTVARWELGIARMTRRTGTQLRLLFGDGEQPRPQPRHRCGGQREPGSRRREDR